MPPPDSADLRLRVIPAIAEVDAAAWDACANPTVAEAADGALVGVVPCYLKSHSRGEYVFDRGWAEAYERAGGEYYPKLQVSVPFTPATGRRLLVSPSPDADRVRSA